MRLLEFVPCGRRATSPEPAEVPAASPPPLSCAVKKEKRRCCRSSAAAWRPSLGAISEDASALKAAKARTAGRSASPANLTPRTTKPPAVVARPRSDRDDFRHLSVPAFAPTAFMF